MITVIGNRFVASKFRSVASGTKSKITAAMERSVALVHRDVLTRGMTGRASNNSFWGKMGGDPNSGAIATRTGSTKRSVASQVFTTRDTVVGTVGTPQKYMEALEDGATIHGSPMLRIPTGAVKTGAGVDRMAGVTLNSGSFGGNTWIGKSKRGNLFIFLKGRGDKPIALYMLVEKVTIRPRHVFWWTTKRTTPRVLAQMGSAATTIVLDAGGHA